MPNMADVGRNTSFSGAKMSKSSRPENKEAQGNKFANDGSFMEMFRKKMEEQKGEKTTRDMDETGQSDWVAPSGLSVPAVAAASSTVSSAAETVNKPTRPLPFVGKRRGSTPVLKTGTVKKTKKDPEEDSPKKDAWSQYLAEVKRYKEQSCQEENKTRPLVK